MVEVVLFHITIALLRGVKPLVTLFTYYDNYLLFSVFHQPVVVQVLLALELILLKHLRSQALLC